MSEEQARKTVLAVMLIVTVIVFWENLVKNGNLLPPGKTIVVMLVLFAGLSIGASLAPEIVGPFSLLVGMAIAISRVPSTPGPFLKHYATPPPTTTTAGTTGAYGSSDPRSNLPG